MINDGLTQLATHGAAFTTETILAKNIISHTSQVVAGTLDTFVVELTSWSKSYITKMVIFNQAWSGVVNQLKSGCLYSQPRQIKSIYGTSSCKDANTCASLAQSGKCWSQ